MYHMRSRSKYEFVIYLSVYVFNISEKCTACFILRTTTYLASHSHGT